MYCYEEHGTDIPRKCKYSKEVFAVAVNIFGQSEG